MKVKVGKSGIIVSENYNWTQFGMLIFNRHEIDDLVLHIRYKSGSQHPKFAKKIQISVTLYNILTQLIDTQEINYELIKQLNTEEKELFNKIMQASKLSKQLKYRIMETEPDKNFYKNRYNVLQGEIEAGNTSRVVKTELIDTIYRLVAFHELTLEAAQEMVKELKEFN